MSSRARFECLVLSVLLYPTHTRTGGTACFCVYLVVEKGGWNVSRVGVRGWRWPRELALGVGLASWHWGLALGLALEVCMRF